MDHPVKSFIKTSLLGGLVIILPVAILAILFKWVFRFVTDLIQPLTNLISRAVPVPEVLADFLVLTIIVATCFILGVVVRTKFGNLIHGKFDRVLQRMAPGYRMVKDVVVQLFTEGESSPFRNGEVARVKVFGNDVATEVTALVTDRHGDGSYTVFVPTGPNPTTGFIFHVDEAQVSLFPELKLDAAMRTVIACGSGSAALFNTRAESKV